jgi:clan AA aspartic protease (TIGR02281 family)
MRGALGALDDLGQLCGVAIAAAGFLLSIAAPAHAELYSWVDASGRQHFTSDLHEVPPEHRPAARSAATKPLGGNPIQTYSASPSSVRHASPASPAPSAGTNPDAGVVRVRVERAGTSMLVAVKLNNSVVAPFLIDTGASDVVIPRGVADQLGLDLSNARKQQYSTANGVVTAPLVTLDSVDLSGARAEQVPASVSDSMSVGLLGLSYFNRFHYQVDPVQGIVTLRPNGLEEAGLIRGGRSEADWRAEYGQLRGRLGWVDAQERELRGGHSERRSQLAYWRRELERQLELLDSEADQARVPFAWRE